MCIKELNDGNVLTLYFKQLSGQTYFLCAGIKSQWNRSGDRMFLPYYDIHLRDKDFREKN